MKSLNIFISKIKVLKIKVSLILKDAEDIRVDFNSPPTINKFTIDGNKYGTINAFPFISLDISGRDKYDPKSRINLNKFKTFVLLKALRRMRKMLDTEGLYRYEGDELIINENLREKVKDINNYGNGTILLVPTVIREEHQDSIKGIALCINEFANYVLLSKTEIEFLIYTLDKLDLESLAIQLMNIFNYKGDTNSNTTYTSTMIPRQRNDITAFTPNLIDETTVPEI